MKHAEKGDGYGVVVAGVGGTDRPSDAPRQLRRRRPDEARDARRRRRRVRRVEAGQRPVHRLPHVRADARGGAEAHARDDVGTGEEGEGLTAVRRGDKVVDAEGGDGVGVGAFEEARGEDAHVDGAPQDVLQLAQIVAAVEDDLREGERGVGGMWAAGASAEGRESELCGAIDPAWIQRSLLPLL